jgi:hypothetical protein
MLNERWRALVRKYVVYDVPDEMAACFDCHVSHCSNDEYEMCPRRLARLAEMNATQALERRAVGPVMTAR